MSPAHDQQWREQTLSTHVRHGRYCAACGQSWQCDSYIRAHSERPASRWGRWRRRLAIAVAVVAVVLLYEWPRQTLLVAAMLVVLAMLVGVVGVMVLMARGRS